MDLADLSRCIFEFYNTQNDNVRKQCSQQLEALQELPDWWKALIALSQSNYPPVVQFYAAKNLYSLLNKNFDLFAENSANTDEIRNFYVQKLSTGVQTLPHSQINVLSSGLAVLLMKCLPDIWPNPFSDLAKQWFNQQELLLRVLAEVGAEFPRISLPLKQRNVLRAELLKFSQDIVKIANTVLVDPESTPSLKNAAVECVELWLKLPGAKISDFLPVFSAVFDNISADIVALSKILSTLKSNEELPKLPTLVMQIMQFIATSAVPLILNEVSNAMQSNEDFADRLNDVIPLIFSVTEFVHTFISELVTHAAQALQSEDRTHVNVYFNLCNFFSQLSNMKGVYPVEECLSDLPEEYWYALREELMESDLKMEQHRQNKLHLLKETSKFYLEMLQNVVDKIAYFPEVLHKCDKLELERFDFYRISRGDVSMNALCVDHEKTVILLVDLTNKFLADHDIYRCEAVLYYFCKVADFLKEAHMEPVVALLFKCGEPKGWPAMDLNGLQRYGRTLLSFLRRIEHLLLTSSNAKQLILQIVSIVLGFFAIPNLDKSVIDTLIALVKNRDAVLQESANLIISECYKYFEDETHVDELRLDAIRCMGISLSIKPNAFILESLDQFLLPRFLALRNVVGENCGLLVAEQDRRIVFELGVLSQLVATLESNNTDGNLLEEEDEGWGDEDDAHGQQPAALSPVRLIIDQCVSFFDVVFEKRPIPSAELVTKVCEVLRSGLLSLHTSAAPLVDTYLKYLDVFLFHFPASSCELAKAIFLTFRLDTQLATTLFMRLGQWYMELVNRINARQPANILEIDEKFIELAQHVVKKNWLTLESVARNADFSKYVDCFLQSVCCISMKVIEHSRDVSLMQDAFRTVSMIFEKCAASDTQSLQKIFDDVGQPVVSTTFMCVQSEVCTTHIPQISDIIYHFAKSRPLQARQCILNLPGGDSPLCEAMFSANLSSKNFRLRVAQLHKAFLKRAV